MTAVLTWQRLRDLKWSEFQDAADGWGEASNRADAARDRVSNEMANQLSKSQKGEAATAALGRLKRLDRNFEYIYTECGLVRTTLNSLAFELSGAQRSAAERSGAQRSAAERSGAQRSAAERSGG
ncbi:hypothetical protein ACFRKB_03800 [Streptomyces scopuliridis]|uniref:hypothetical protein n=1 Tax=Streptomyces scopuliridis TaxID=452529 RepID=UPI00367B394A